MTSRNILLLFIVLFAFGSCKQQPKDSSEFSPEKAKETLDFAIQQYKGMIPKVPEGVLPSSFIDGEFKTTGINGWVSGFYPGSLWYLYEYSNDESLKAEAEKKTWLLEPIKNNTGTHDLGFMIFCSYGNAYRITKNEDYAPVIIKGSESLSTRFNETAGVIKSWDFTRGDDWSYPVIIDNMMNLEMLLWASDYSDNPRFKEIALSHADTTMKHHYREDYSTWHVVDYDTVNGGAKGKMTHQGYSDESSWARGQAWGLYGYTMMYRMTGRTKYLDFAKKIADFILTHPNLPEDKIPYWDFDAPDIPDAYRDASSGAIIASALLDMSKLVNDESLSTLYYDNASQMLSSLSSPDYLAELNENGNFILMHGVGHLPGNSQIDVPLSYGDYYFIEALVRYLDAQ